MCDPVSLAVTSAAITGFQAYSQYQTAKSNAAAINTAAANNAKVAEQNARVKELEAADTRERGSQEAYDIRQRARVATSTGRAIMAGSGFLADTGTNVDLQAQNMQMGEADALTAYDNANRSAWTSETEAKSIRFGSKVDVANARAQAAVTKQAGLLDAAGTFASGASKAGNWFYENRKK